jgi:hypothetical protein
MPITTQSVSERYALRPGEKWWTCGNCGRILAKVLPDGKVQKKSPEGWLYIEPTPSATVTIACGCTDPPFQEVYMLNK